MHPVFAIVNKGYKGRGWQGGGIFGTNINLSNSENEDYEQGSRSGPRNDL